MVLVKVLTFGETSRYYELLKQDDRQKNDCANGTKTINQVVKNNIDKFPERFSFLLTDVEMMNLRSTISTSSASTHGGRRYAVRVFTEQGVAMLSTILKSKTAIQVSIAIMDAFVAMRKYISSNLLEQKYINELVLEDQDKIKVLEDSFQKLEEKKRLMGK